MLTSLLLAALVVQADAPDTAAPRADSTAFATAYLDPGARELVAAARERRAWVKREIEAYRVLAKRRISMGARAGRWERTLYREETAAQVEWSRSGVNRVEVLGARQAVPLVRSGVEVPDDLAEGATYLAFDPADDRMLSNMLEGEDWLRHPLAPGAEADYRYGSGDTTTVRLPDGYTLRLVELQVHPRRRSSQLVRGSFLIDLEGHSVVQAAFTLAEPFDLSVNVGRREGRAEGRRERGSRRGVPLLLRPVLTPIHADVRHLVIEYGLWDRRWWLPRVVVFEGVADVGALPEVAVQFELSYAGYELVAAQAADAGALVLAEEPPDDRPERCPPRDEQRAADRARAEAATVEDPTVEQAALARETREVCTCQRGVCRWYEVHVPSDTSRLIESAELPPSIFDADEMVISGEQLRQLTAPLRVLATPSFRHDRPRAYWRVASSDLVRYNRVEGASVGALAAIEYGPVRASATGRFGFADREPLFELGAARETYTSRVGLTAYRRLALTVPESRALGLGNTFTALLFGRDDGDYFRTTGVELTGSPPRGVAQRFGWRVFAEQQRSVLKSTEFSVRRLFNDELVFRPNIEADRADQVGAALFFRLVRGEDPGALRWSAALEAEGSWGTFDFGRSTATVAGSMPLGERVAVGMELAAGTSAGTLPVQSLYHLGGRASARGYVPGTLAGETFWRARAELANALPGARVVLFSDAAWAGERSELSVDPPLLSAGVGASFLDGLFRFDLARALRGPTGWRVEAYFGGPL